MLFKTLLILLLIFSCKSNQNEFIISNYDWCYPDCINPISAIKLNSDGSFNSSTSMFGGSTRWGNWEYVDKNKIKLKSTKASTISGQKINLENQIITIISNKKLKLNNTIYLRN